MKRNVREHTLTFVLLAATLAVTFFPVLFENYTLLPSDMIDTMTLPYSQSYGPPQAANSYVSDGLLQFYSYKLMLRNAWRQGRFAFWNPLNLCGYPAYAETMATNFDPLNIILLVLPFQLAFNIYLILPLLIAGMGFYIFICSYNIHVRIARIFATSYMLCGLFITHLLPHFIPGSMCWAPFICYFIKRYYDTEAKKHIVLAGVSLCLGFLGGNLQTAMFLAFLLTLFGLSYRTDIGIVFSKRAIFLSLTFMTGFLLSAIMWLPTLELFWNVLQGGIISSTSYTHVYSIGQRFLSIPMLLTFFIPYIAGGAKGISAYSSLGLYVIDFNATIGYIPLLLGLWAVITRRADRNIQPFVWIVLCGFLLPIATPLFRFLYHRFFIIGIFGLCAAGAIGLQRILDDKLIRNSAILWVRRSFYVFVSASGVILIAGLLILINYQRALDIATIYLLPRIEHISFSEGNHPWIEDRMRATIDNYSLASPVLMLTLASVAIGYYLIFKLLVTPNRNRNTKLTGIWLIVAFQVGMFAYTWLPHVEMAKSPIAPKTQLTDFLSHQRSKRLFVDRREHEHEQYLFLDNQNSVYGIPVLSGFESLQIRSFYLQLPRFTSDSTMPANLLGLLNVKYILTGRSSNLPTDKLQMIDSAKWKLWENTIPARRVWISDEIIASPNDSNTIARLQDTSYDPRVAIFSNEKYESLPLSHDSLHSSATITNDEPESVEIEAYSNHRGYLILSDTYYPGWKCYVDGDAKQIYRVNYAMRAVYIESGQHKVEFVFEPLTFRIGVWISLLSFAGIFSFGIVHSFHRSSASHLQ